MDPDESLLLSNQLCFSLYAAQHAMTRVYRPLLEEMGLTYPQYLVLLLLWERDGLAVKELGERLSLDSGTLTPLLKRLEAQEIVRRTRDTADERVVRIHLTTAGAALRGEALCVPGRIAAAAGLTLDEMEALRRELNRLRGALDGASERIG